MSHSNYACNPDDTHFKTPYERFPLLILPKSNAIYAMWGDGLGSQVLRWQVIRFSGGRLSGSQVAGYQVIRWQVIRLSGGRLSGYQVAGYQVIRLSSCRQPIANS